MADLQELFARLNGQHAGNQSPGYHHPSVSSPIYSPSPSGPHPHHQSAIMSPNTSVANTPAPEQGLLQQQTPQQQSAQLLNLLRFNSQPGVAQARRSSQNTQASEGASAHARTYSASDLVAGFASKTSPQAPAAAQPAAASSENPQDLLLRLLNHPKPSQTESPSSRASASFPPHVATKMPETAVDDLAQDLADAQLERVSSDPTARAPSASPMRIFGSDGSGPSTQAEPDVGAAPPKFTYINPFDKLEAASPRTRTPAQEAARPPPPKMEILKSKHALDVSGIFGSASNDLHKDKAPKMSPESTAHPHETVAEAVSDLGDQVGHQVDEALAEAETQAEAQVEQMPAEEVKEIQEAIVDTAVEIKKELEDESNTQALAQTLPKPLAAALKEVASEVADSWESADVEDSPTKEEDQTVIVYRFPMKAFASITIKDMPTRRPSFAPDLFMDIARLKKEFDQIDRSLVSASKNFIVYALVKKGGFRIIRQENGQYRQVFESHAERMFNIAVCTTSDESSSMRESILGIGVNGTVFWTSLEPSREDQFGEDLDTQGLLLPPSPSQDDNTSGGQLKTRAKPSSRHPEYFAVGRGKSIHIIWPQVAAEYLKNPKSRICHTEKYLKERSLKILTGKAGKDFTFSEDDTVIVSLDKAGRMRFWDIRPLTAPELGIPRGPPQQVEVSDTLLEFHTTSPNAKSWPTSVFFFDKDRPFSKGIALRYVMVGMKQNHAFQLWDLGLGKAVQEINLPHEKESDAICSVAFHPRTGIMAVAHPTRNSIFFIHVSCPRYNLPVMSQAQYITRLASKSDRTSTPLPPVNATAIMTSITEYSFASKGQIRSLHMLNDPAGPADVDDPDNTALFELYAMHSKGVCTLRVRRSDLGWKKEGEPLHPKEAEEEGIITLSALKTPQPVADESSVGGETPGPKSSSDRSVRESIKKESSNVSKHTMTPEAAMRASTLAKVESKQDAARAAILNGGEKPEKKKKKKAAASEVASQVSTSTRAPLPSYAQAAQATPRSKSPAAPEPTAEPTVSKTADLEPPEWAQKLISQFQQSSSASTPAFASAINVDVQHLEEVVQAEITKGFSRELDVMYKRFDEDKRVLNAANNAKQDAILRLVSSTLTENVEGVIRKMVDENIRTVLLPQVLNQTSTTLEKSVASNVKSTLSAQVSKEIPDAVSRALKSPQFFQSLSEQVSKKVTGGLEPVIVAAVGSAVNPAISTLTNLIEHQVAERLRQDQVQRVRDAEKIAQLTDTVQACLETIQSMASNQAELQTQVAKLQQHLSQTASQPSSVEHSSPRVTRSPPKQKTPEELETETIKRLMTEGKYEQGTMQWLQSPRTSELFDTVFVRCDPAYLSQVSPLLALSTGAVVTESLDHNLPERLVWLDAVLRNVNPHDNEIHDIVPKIMDVMNQRLTTAYIKLNESSPGNPLLRRISALVSTVNELARAATYGPR
ncbi:hypothetical protein BS50DRAFT_492414 [Corynespora cassiicola Philippines]|uniref:EDC4-like protein pdc1 beta-propeller domain-containing protein n=1 Tax=Corynespora cassiicola Philippines TaxID=1448308 RepID=A0A2T2NSY1_CORCC|nr:hypothetical protein BS50DRAFT_492414 [Corynespora cassiicola Philippines]